VVVLGQNSIGQLEPAKCQSALPMMAVIARADGINAAGATEVSVSGRRRRQDCLKRRLISQLVAEK